MITYALALAARGFAVFPCHTITSTGACSCGKSACDSPGKHPATRDGFKSATRAETTLRAMWAGAVAYNIGIACGAPSGGLQVIDADGDEGLASVAGYPPTLSARTGSGGMHLYYRIDGEQRNTTRRVAPGVDSRGDGGYVIAPPSLHHSGGVYAWVDEGADITPLPADILAAMRRRGPRATLRADLPAVPAPAPAPPPTRVDTEAQRGRRYALAALAGAADDLRRAPQGVRHDEAYKKAFKLGGYVGSGLLAEHEVEAGLLTATRAGGWSADREPNTLRAIRDGMREGATKPLEPPAPSPRPRTKSGDPERVAIRDEPRAPRDPSVVALIAQVAEIPVLSLLRTREGEAKATYANTVAVVRHIHGGAPTNPERHLAFNLMTLAPVLDGVPQREGHDLSALRERIELEHGFAPSAENVKAAIIHVAHENAFHPVRAFLDALPPWDGIPRAELLAQKVLHVDLSVQPLAAVFLRKWLISAVARAYEPGCQVDTALVLFGHQGLRKSGFYRTLADPWFLDTKMDISNKDAYMQLHSAWIVEWGEIDSITSQRHAGEVKGFITSAIDVFRAPYAAAVASHARSGVIVGSTNKEKFLSDPTGSRRFWIIDLDHLDPAKGHRLDLVSLALMRHQLWAEAVSSFRAFQAHRLLGGDPEDNPWKWWLSSAEDADRETSAERHAVDDDPWVEVVERLLAKRSGRQPLRFPQDQIQIADIFDGMKLEAAQRKYADGIRMGAVLRRLGYERRKVRVQYGDRSTVWMWLRADE